MSLGKGEGVDKKSDKKLKQEGGHANKKVMPVTQSFLFIFFCNSILYFFISLLLGIIKHW